MADRAATLRWCGGGIVEIASSDGKDLLFIDAWFWNNAGWERFDVAKPAEYASPEGFVDYVTAKDPESVLIALTHDHGDHVKDYFEALRALSDAGVNVRTTAQADLVQFHLMDQYTDAGIDVETVVANSGRGANIGGTTRHGGMTTWTVPAVHSTTAGFPAVGYVVEVGGVRLYCSGDTDLFGDMALIGERYDPDVAVVCIGNGPFTMGPDGAARAVKMLGASHAVPIHYAHNPLVRQPDAGPEFEDLVSQQDSSIRTHVIRPGDSVTFEF
ncbi:MAG: MBL fold metallo-hydrolase [Nitriliruptoraceae bacterium]